MTTETKTEIVVFSGIAAFLGILWYVTRPGSTTNGSPLAGLLAGLLNSQGGGGGVASSTLPLIAATPGDTFNYSAGQALPANLPGNASCNTCTGAGSNNVQFGSPANLADYLAGLSGGNFGSELAAAVNGGWS